MERELPILLAGQPEVRRRPAAPSFLQTLGLIAVGLLFLGLFSLPHHIGRSVPAGPLPGADFQWQKVEEGYEVGRYSLSEGSQVLKSEVLLLKFSPQRFSFRPVSSSELEQPASDLRTLTLAVGGVAGINANFFDENGSPLGLLIQDGAQKHRMHKGGKLMGGIFSITGQKATIVHRDSFEAWQSDCALQAGPRLIVKGKATKVSEPPEQSRRSGIAVTRSGAVVLYATFLRFPGATLEQIQKMLLDPRLDVEEALNLDGGGSSQLFIRKNPLSVDDTFISGGDKVPVGLVVQHRPGS